MTSGIDLSRGGYAVAALRFALVTDVAMLCASLVNLLLYTRMQSGDDVGDDQLAAMEAAGSLIGTVSLVAMVAGAVCFIRWLMQARRNVDALGARGLAHSPQWALWGWFVPIMNLFRPYQVVDEVWRGSDPQPGRPLGTMSESAPGWMTAWWGCWLVAGVLSQFAFRLQVDLEEPAAPAALLQIERLLSIAGVLSVAAAVLAIRLVRGIDARQRARAARMAAEAEHPREPALA